MADKRDKKRHPKRFTLRFGAEEATRLGFTEDISREGLFIKTSQFLPSGSRIVVELSVNDQIVKIEGQVKWTKQVPPNMINIVKKSGFGIQIIRFLTGEDIYNSLFE